MQHDTSPHEVEVGGRKYKAQTASAVPCYSRMPFLSINPTFQRFDCKVFLTDAVRYTTGAPERATIDNTHVVVLRGTGREMVPGARDGGVRRPSLGSALWRTNGATPIVRRVWNARFH